MKERKSTHITRQNYFLSLREKKRIKDFIMANPKMTQTEIGDKFKVSRGTISNIKRDQTLKIEELMQQMEREVYEHPVYKEMQNKLRWAEKQIFNDRNKINQLCARIHDLELRILSLNRQLEDPTQP